MEAVEHEIMIEADREDLTIAADDPIVKSIRAKLPKLLERERIEAQSCSIFRVRSSLRHGNETTFTPTLVSIGPYHCNNPKLKEMEEVKLNFLFDLIQRSPEENTVDRYVKAVKAINPEEAMSQYSENLNLDHDKFVEMMVIDGCFILEFLIKWYLNDRQAKMSNVKEKLPVLKTDLLLVENQIPFSILEALFKASYIPQFNKKVNQIPFSILDVLYKVSDIRQFIKKAKDFGGKGKQFATLIELALVYFGRDTINAHLEAKILSKMDKPFHHLLHLFHSSLDPEHHRNMEGLAWIKKIANKIMNPSLSFLCLIPFFKVLLNTITDYPFVRWIKKIVSIPFWILKWLLLATLWCIKTLWWCIKKILGLFIKTSGGHHQWLSGIPSARYLRDSGFRFRRKIRKSCFLDVSHSGRTIIIPHLSIQNTTPILFKNLIAFEQSSPTDCSNYVTSYATFMDNIIDTDEDVAILTKCGIIDNRLGDNGKVADLFNNLCKDIYFHSDQHYLSPLFDYVTEYYTRHYYKIKFYQWRNMFIPDYFTNPWAVPSMIAASVLLLLTGLQTFYTVFPYYHPRS